MTERLEQDSPLESIHEILENVDKIARAAAGPHTERMALPRPRFLKGLGCVSYQQIGTLLDLRLTEADSREGLQTAELDFKYLVHDENSIESDPETSVTLNFAVKKEIKTAAPSWLIMEKNAAGQETVRFVEEGEDVPQDAIYHEPDKTDSTYTHWYDLQGDAFVSRETGEPLPDADIRQLADFVQEVTSAYLRTD